MVPTNSSLNLFIKTKKEYKIWCFSPFNRVTGCMNCRQVPTQLPTFTYRYTDIGTVPNMQVEYPVGSKICVSLFFQIVHADKCPYICVYRGCQEKYKDTKVSYLTSGSGSSKAEFWKLDPDPDPTGTYQESIQTSTLFSHQTYRRYFF